jgi:NTP pyrophosphatase (non-canonical NTP hydrolase)
MKERFETQVMHWARTCFGDHDAFSPQQRTHRFVEEALELAQACGVTRDDVLQLVDYVFSRPTGETAQEVGGVMVTLGLLCYVQGIDMHEAGDTELARVWTKIEAIRVKQAAKQPGSPLPGPTPPLE